MMIDEITTFANLGLDSSIMKALEKKGYNHPTRVQAEAIPPLMNWQDVIAKAPTGTGKTFAFGIPIIEHIDPESEALQALILAPTRELAIQICDELRSLLIYSPGIRVAVVYGGAKLETQQRSLQKHPQILVATPGRLMDHYNRKNLRLDGIHTVILDEADRMLDMGFFKDVTKILDRIKMLQAVTVCGVTHPKKHLGLFSATISEDVMTVSWMYQREELEITVPADTENKPDIAQYSITVSAIAKMETTLRLLRCGQFDRAIIFCNTKHMCQRLNDDLQKCGILVDCIHGDIRQIQREKVMKNFRTGKLSILVATDVAARGIDVDDVDCVINYDIPDENEYYIHRIGRTGRARKKGVSYAIVGTFPEKAKLDEIAKYSQFVIHPMKFNQAGELVEEVAKETPIKRKYK